MSTVRTVRLCATKYLGPTNRRGSRVQAKHLTTGRKVLLPWDDALSAFDNHCAAALSLFGRFPHFSSAVDGGGYIFGQEQTP